MIAQQTIDEILQRADIVEVISKDVNLKKSGSNYKACSPFTDEKTASFLVSPAKQIFKCFSTGKGGGVWPWLRDYKKLSFPEAMQFLADMYNVIVQKQEDGLTQEERVQRQQKNKTRADIMLWATQRYNTELRTLPNSHDAAKYLKSRGYTEEQIIEWQLGYAPEYSKILRAPLVQQGKEKIAKELYLVGDKVDRMLNRIVFPIADIHGNTIGFAGRAIGEQKPKYLNPADTPLYKKERTLYGLHLAAKAIQKEEEAILVEGYTDVIAMHNAELNNTVASCGTAITIEQIKLLKRYAKSALLLMDGDAAGIKSLERALPLFLESGVDAYCAILPDEQDPDSAIAEGVNMEEFISKSRQDLLLYLAAKKLSEAKNIRAKADLLEEITLWLSKVKHPVMRGNYIEQLITISGGEYSKMLFKDAFKRLEETQRAQQKRETLNLENNPLAHLTKEQQDEVHQFGFYEQVSKGNEAKTGFFFRTDSEGHFKKVSNFIFKPLFHKQDEEDNTRFIQLDRGFGDPIIREMNSDDFMSVDAFRKFFWNQGPFFFDGSKMHLDKIIKKYKEDFPPVIELKNLGWQEKDKFWAFENYSFNGKLDKYNELGIVKHGENHFFSPAASIIYEHLRQDNDMYENDRYLTFKETPLNFATWADLMHKVYGQHAFAAVNFAFISLYKDLVFKVDNNCPFLYFYGPSQSGKSKCAESLTNLFTHQMSAFNLNSGTDFAFAKRLERFKNVPVGFNEFDDQYIKPEWFQVIKGAYDGEGRERGRGGSKKRTETQKVNCTLTLVGQYLSTKDDNSVLSRSIVRTFQKESNRSAEQTNAYNQLKEYEKQGLSQILTELLPYREKLEQDYYPIFNKCYKRILDEGRKDGKFYNERVTRNYASLLTMQVCFEDYGLRYPWNKNSYFLWVMEEVEHISSMIQSNDVLTDFWTTVETLFNDAIIRDGVHYKLVDRTKIRITKNRRDQSEELDDPTEVLYIRLRNVQQLYAKFKRSVGGMALDIVSLETYIKQRDYYLGRVDSEKFAHVGGSGASVSAYLIDYKNLGISLQHSDKETEEIL